MFFPGEVEWTIIIKTGITHHRILPVLAAIPDANAGRIADADAGELFKRNGV